MEPYFYRKNGYVVATEHGGGPWDPRMLHGGAPTALIASIVEDLPSEVPMSVTRLTVDLQRPVPVGQLDITVNVTREGRNIQTSEVILSANGKQVVRAAALKMRKEMLDLPEGSAMPEIAGHVPEARTGFPRPVGFNNAVDMREEEPGARKRVWFHIERPFFDDRETTPLMRAAATGDYCNGFGSTLNFEEWTYINADLTLHFAREPVGEWMMLAANSWIGPDGRGLAFGELSDQHGPVGRAIQSLVIARR
ncbi:MAG TPA: thioesterase family protein [Hyphomonas sp.]|nr:thioesterase family protein [Hyphomonas sp.]MCB9963221.1 thioesterase family protein [Hyphomonas sp.]MCB9971379.1 thioesterase family protein [Hyphomonas sp.]HPE48868.1 thioesterase family protein [Hyphomonas sp.]